MPSLLRDRIIGHSRQTRGALPLWSRSKECSVTCAAHDGPRSCGKRLDGSGRQGILRDQRVRDEGAGKNASDDRSALGTRQRG